MISPVLQVSERQEAEMRRGEQFRARMTLLRQAKIKEACDQIEHHHIEGVGQKVATIDPELAARLRVKDGLGCLHDPEYLRTLLRDNPFLRIRCNAPRLSVRVDGLRNVQLNKPIHSAGRHGAQGDPAPPRGHACSGHETTTGAVTISR